MGGDHAKTGEWHDQLSVFKRHPLLHREWVRWGPEWASPRGRREVNRSETYSRSTVSVRVAYKGEGA